MHRTLESDSGINFDKFENRAVGGRIVWELMEDALSPKATSAAVDLGELKIVVFRPLDGATFVFLYTVARSTTSPHAHAPFLQGE